MLIRLTFILILSLTAFIKAQVLREFEITENKITGSIPVPVNYPDDAVLVIYSAIKDLSFDSNTGGIIDQKSDGTKYIVIIKTERQFITVKARGFMEQKISIPKLAPKGSLSYTINEKSAGQPDISITILTEPETDRIYIDSVFAGKVVSYKTKAGLKKIRIEKDGYFPLDTMIVISSDNTFFQFTLKKAEEIRVAVSSKPIGAFIYIDEKFDGGQTDKQMFLLPGSYSLRLTKTGYLDTTVVITVVPGAQNEFVYDLIKNEAILDITVSPADAILTINNTEYKPGRIELQPGKYIIEVTRAGYIKQSDNLVISLASRVSRNYTLIKNDATLNITVDPSDAELTVDGVRQQPGKIEVSPGRKIIEITRQQYLPQRDTVDAPLGSSISKAYRLEKNTGFLAISAPAFEFTFTIDGKNTIVSSRLELEAGRYLLKAEKTGYYPWQQSVTVKRGETQNITIDLLTVTGGIQFSVSPAEAEFRLLQNNQEKYKWKGASRREDILAGEYILVVSLPQHEDYRETINIREKDILKRDINLKKILTQEELDKTQTGKLLVQVEPTQAEVRLSLDGVVVHEWRGSRILDELKTGDYDVECFLNGYHTFTDEVTVKTAQTTDLIISLKKIDLAAAQSKPWYTQWYYYAAGAAVGGIAAFLLASKEKEENARETLVTSPGRP